jgi:hypothetical protein
VPGRIAALLAARPAPAGAWRIHRDFARASIHKPVVSCSSAGSKSLSRAVPSAAEDIHVVGKTDDWVTRWQPSGSTVPTSS